MLRNWHATNTPSVDNEMFKMFMMAYCGQARKLYNDGKLMQNHIFMLQA